MTTTEARPAATVLQLCLRNGTTAGGAEENFLLYSFFAFLRIPGPLKIGLTQIPARLKIGLTQIPAHFKIGHTQIPDHFLIGLTKIPVAS